VKKITIEFIEHPMQRLGEVGDWWFDHEGDLHVRVSDLGEWRYNFLFARHEMDEAILCKYAGISTEMVDEDQKERGSESDDPDSFSGYPGSPYQQQHNDALAAEWTMSRLLGVTWSYYAHAVGVVEGDGYHGEKEGSGDSWEERENALSEERTEGSRSRKEKEVLTHAPQKGKIKSRNI